MRDIRSLPQDLRDRVAGRDFIVFDGECVLCSGFFHFMLARDHAARFHFVVAQSPLGNALYQALNLPTDDFETNLVVVDGTIYEELDAFAAAMSVLGWPWRALSALRYLPTIIKRPFYRAIARNRYAIFGRSNACLMPDKPLRARFLSNGFG